MALADSDDEATTTSTSERIEQARVSIDVNTLTLHVVIIM